MSDTHDHPANDPEHSTPPSVGGTGAPSPGAQTAADGDRSAAPERPRDDTVSLLDLIAVLARRWKLIFFTTFFAAIGIVLFSLYTLRIPPDSAYNPLPNYYRPQAQILLSDSNSSSGLSNSLSSSDLGLLAGLANIGGGQGESSAALATELLTGNTLVDQIIEEFKLLDKYANSETPRAAARKAVRTSLTSEFDSASGILTVSYEDIDPVFATDVLQRVVVLVESRFTFLTRDTARARTEAIELQLQQLEDDLKQASDAFTSFQKRYGVIDPETQGQQTVDLITNFRKQVFELELQREQIIDVVKDPEDPQVQRINHNISRLEELISELETGYRTYTPVSIPLDQIGEISARYAELQRDLMLKQQVYSSIQAQLISARIDSQNTMRRFQVIEPPEVPELKAGPSRGMISIIVTITAFFLSVFLAFVLEYFTRAKDDPDEAQKIELIKDQFRFRKRS